jgi:exopolysaccharide production protein ExoZ
VLKDLLSVSHELMMEMVPMGYYLKSTDDPKGAGSMSKELIGIQYLRGIAAMLVVLHHLYFDHTQLGPFAVKIFFVISGFVMWHTAAAAYISPLVFWRRRIIRIVPLYWIWLTILVAIALTAPQYLKSTVITPEAVVKSFLFIPHYHASQNFIAPILVPGWSLNYEMFFYFIFGIGLLVASDALRAIMIGVVLWSLVLLGLSLNPENAAAATYTNPDVLLFFNGIILAMIYRAYGIDSVMLGLILICFGVLSRSLSISGDFGLFENFIGLSPTLIVAGTLALEPALRHAPSLVLHTIGNASYSIYLSHLFFLRLSDLGWAHFVALGSNKAAEVTYVAFAFVFAIAGGIAVHYLIERPMLLLFHQGQVTTKPA